MHTWCGRPLWVNHACSRRSFPHHMYTHSLASWLLIAHRYRRWQDGSRCFISEQGSLRYTAWKADWGDWVSARQSAKVRTPGRQVSGLHRSSSLETARHFIEAISAALQGRQAPSWCTKATFHGEWWPTEDRACGVCGGTRKSHHWVHSWRGQW